MIKLDEVTEKMGSNHLNLPNSCCGQRKRDVERTFDDFSAKRAGEA